MATGRRKTPDFFNEDGLDPVESATGYPQRSSRDKPSASSEAAAKAGSTPEMAAKKKAGFYLSIDILNRFTHKFHELKLAGVAIDNKSNLLEAALNFALDDMDKGEGSQVLRKLEEI
jgi:hypothetical protein